MATTEIEQAGKHAAEHARKTARACLHPNWKAPDDRSYSGRYWTDDDRVRGGIERTETCLHCGSCRVRMINGVFEEARGWWLPKEYVSKCIALAERRKREELAHRDYVALQQRRDDEWLARVAAEREEGLRR